MAAFLLVNQFSPINFFEPMSSKVAVRRYPYPHGLRSKPCGAFRIVCVEYQTSSRFFLLVGNFSKPSDLNSIILQFKSL